MFETFITVESLLYTRIDFFSDRTQIIFCHSGFGASDFQAINKLMAVLNIRASFLDYEHYSTSVQDDVVLSVDDKWQIFHGKSTVLIVNDQVVTRRYVCCCE
jgi:hypothetical protein